MSISEKDLEEHKDIADKVCSMLVGIPRNDVARLREKQDKIKYSVMNTLKLLEKLCKDESVEYKELLFTFYFDYCFRFLSEENKIKELTRIISYMIMNTKGEKNELKKEFDNIFRKELCEVSKNS